ncbi:MAG: TIGR00341 family protein [Bacteroidaceae bacterium]|nr:TIGR00341 family protein [Bacteroidaceae bacterium]
MNIFTNIKDEMARLLNLEEDAAEQKEVVEGIHAGIDFRGAKLWILVFAIFVASLGLNTNSTAVIIGAMLISPLMGPIIGMGLSIGINDFENFKRSLRSLAVATIFSVTTATLYWLITPMAETQSELLARTSPTIWDVFIALFGGLAGIIALTSRSQRTGNVIPGVAIATALMPPLCTVGFGLGTGQWLYALGAFYLYIINCIFISVATFIGVRLMKFHDKVFTDKSRERRVRQYITAIVVVTMIPACYLTYTMVRETVWTNHAQTFVEKELQFDGTQIIARELDFDDRSIQVVLIGNEVADEDTAAVRKRLADYYLDGTRLDIIQGNNSSDMDELRGILQGAKREAANTAEMVSEQRHRIEALQGELAPYRELDSQSGLIANEMSALFDNVRSLSLSRSVLVSVPDTVAHDTVTMAVVAVSGRLSADDQERMTEWLRTRLKDESLSVVLQ